MLIKIDHVLSHKACLNEFNRFYVIQDMIPETNGINLEINYINIFQNAPNMWIVNTLTFHQPMGEKEIEREGGFLN